MNDFYVYIYYRLDTNEPFYVGKGYNDRCYELSHSRNDHFKNIINKYPIAVEIVADNLTEDQAFGIECYLIHELVFEYSYSIDISNNYSIEEGCHLVNMTWGGDGVSRPHSQEFKDYISKTSSSWWATASEEDIKRRNKKVSESRKGIKLSDEHRKNLSISHMGHIRTEESRMKQSKNNAKYWQDKKRSKDTCNKISKTKGKAVICLTTKKIFYSAKQGRKYYNCSDVNIGRCCRGERKSCGKLNGVPLVWRYLNYKHNKTYRVSGNSVLKRVK